MAYTIEDEDGHVGHGPSINGLRQLKKFLNSPKIKLRKHPALDMLLEHGVTHLTQPLAIECRALAALSTDAPVASSLKSLAQDATKAKGIVMLVSHGLT